MYNSTLDPTTAALKRGMDIVGAFLGLILFSPLMLLVAVLIKISEPAGAVFFIQKRSGQNGKPFNMIKFRSMVRDAEDKLPSLINLDELEEPIFKIKDDPRVTRLGRILRRTSIDELPQLFNVLKGEMSLVGPRPEEVQLVQRYTHWQRKRLIMKPGMTGPAQVNGRSDLTLKQKVEMELEYTEHYSLLKDIHILLKTFPEVIRGKGCY